MFQIKMLVDDGKIKRKYIYFDQIKMKWNGTFLLSDQNVM